MYETLVQLVDDLRRNFATGVSLALPLKGGVVHGKPSLSQFLILLGVLWFLALVSDFIDVGLSAQFSVRGVLAYSSQSYFWLATLAFVVLLDRHPAQFLAVAVPMVSALTVVSSFWIVTTSSWWVLDSASYFEHYEYLWDAFLVWESLVFARIFIVLFHRPLLRSAGYGLAYALSVYAMTSLLPYRPLLVESNDHLVRAPIDIEETYYAQANLLSHSLYALSPERSGEVDLFFVGFAAYADQDVFRREVEQATVIFEQQFDAIGHTIALINNKSTINSVPLANHHNLRRAIGELAGRIALNEDIVVVFLSSHGAENGTIAVDMQNFGLNDLSAQDLREIFDEAKIKWRIVIVSACYSGSFIEQLASPHTLVITAAAADRASFGCAQENEWTYFGRAYFDQALKETPLFIPAFERAREIIAAREAAEEKTPSMPQVSIGSEIESYLLKNAL